MTEIINIISQFFDPVILLLIAVSGYLTFLLFFYGSDHWDNLQWGDRLLIGSILGLALFFCMSWIPNVINYWFVRMRGSALPFDLNAFILTTSYCIFIVILFAFRSKSYTFLHDSTISKKWSKFFNTFKFTYLLEFFIFLVFFILLVDLQYPYPEFLVRNWIAFLIILGFGSLFIYVILPLLLSNLTSMPELTVEMFDNFNDQVERINRKSVFKMAVHLILLFTLAFSIISFDSQFGLFTPKMTFVESLDVVDEELSLIRYWNGETIVKSSDYISYHFIPPLIPILSINSVQIRNPSNFSSVIAEFEPEISCSEGLECFLSQDNEKLNITINNITRIDRSVTIEYFSTLELEHVINIKEKNDIPIIELSNGTKQKIYTISISNLSQYPVRINSFALIELPYFHNVTSFEQNIDWKPEQDSYCHIDESNSKFILSGVLGSEISVNIELNIVYEET